MKNELDDILRLKHLDALLVSGAGQHNPDMVYLTGGAHLTHADLIKKAGEEPVLFYRTMERDEAARTGLRTKDFADFDFDDLVKTAGGNRIQASALRYQKMLADVGVTQGRMGILGRGEIGSNFAVFSELQRLMPDLLLVGEWEDANVLLQARATKEDHEVERIRQMGKITTAVVGRVAEYLSSQRARDGVLVSSDGLPVTVGKVKRLINLWLAEQGAENPEGTIFAIGYDAAVPHSTGTANHPLRLGQTIIFDIFPCEPGGGYFYDFTRTWCLGYAPDEVVALYEDVLAVSHRVKSELRAGVPCHSYQTLTCDLFEARGYATVRSDPRTQEGYVHSIGHGIGLNVHEAPWLSSKASGEEVLRPGMTLTIEPGLYYPAKSMGVRLEDSLWIRPDGRGEVLAPYPEDLVLPVRG